MSAGPSTNVNLPAQLAEVVGDFRGAAKAIKSELKDLDRQARDLKKAGKEVPSSLEGRREALRDEHDRLLRKAEEKQNTQAVNQTITKAVENIDKVQRLPRQLERISRGDLNVGDIASVGAGIRGIGTKLAERGFARAGTAMAMGGQLLSTAAASPITMIATEVVKRSIGEAIKESKAIERVNERQYNYLLNQHQLQVGAGTVSEARQLREFQQEQDVFGRRAEEIIRRSDISANVWEFIYGESSEVKEAGLGARQRQQRIQKMLRYGIEPQISEKEIQKRWASKTLGKTGTSGNAVYDMFYTMYHGDKGEQIKAANLMIYHFFKGSTPEELREDILFETGEEYREEVYQSLIESVKTSIEDFQTDSKRVAAAEKYKSFTSVIERDRLARVGDWMPY